MNNCGYCKNYIPGKTVCGLTNKAVGFLDVKTCFEAPDKTEPKTKVCKRCGRELPLHEFGKHARTADGLQVYCRECSKEAMKNTRMKKVKEVALLKKSSIAAFEDQELLDELKRRGFSGYLKRVVEFSI